MHLCSAVVYSIMLLRLQISLSLPAPISDYELLACIWTVHRAAGHLESEKYKFVVCIRRAISDWRQGLVLMCVI